LGFQSNAVIQTLKATKPDKFAMFGLDVNKFSSSCVGESCAPVN